MLKQKNYKKWRQCAVFLQRHTSSLLNKPLKSGYYIIIEPAGGGYADFVFKPYRRSDPAFIVELKVDDTPDNAIQQIKDTNYMQTLDGYTGAKLAVGISYNKKDKKHFVKIEELQ